MKIIEEPEWDSHDFEEIFDIFMLTLIINFFFIKNFHSG